MKNLILTILVIINTFLAIFALVRTYKDKFSETNGKSMNILFDKIKNKDNVHSVKVNDEHYRHHIKDLSKDKKYLRKLTMEKYKLDDKVFIAADLYLFDINNGDYLYTKHLIEDKNKNDINSIKYNNKEEASIVTSSGKFKNFNKIISIMNNDLLYKLE